MPQQARTKEEKILALIEDRKALVYLMSEILSDLEDGIAGMRTRLEEIELLSVELDLGGPRLLETLETARRSHLRQIEPALILARLAMDQERQRLAFLSETE